MGCSNPHPHGQVWATSHVPAHARAQARDAARVLRAARPRPPRRLPRAGAARTASASSCRERPLGGARAVLGGVAVRDDAGARRAASPTCPRSAATSATRSRTSCAGVTRALRQPLPLLVPVLDGLARPAHRRRGASRVAAARRLLPAAAALGHACASSWSATSSPPSRSATSPPRTRRRACARRPTTPLPGDGLSPTADRPAGALVRRARPSASPSSFGGEAPRVAAAPGPRQPDRRAHRLQRRLRAAHGHRARGRGRLPAARATGVLRAHSVAFGETKEVDDRRASRRPGGTDWFAYVAGVVWAFASKGSPSRGLDAGGRRRRADRRRPLVLGRARDGDGARASPPPAGSPWDAARDGAARPEGREPLRRHELRDHGPVRLGGLRGGPRAAARLPLARDAAGAGAGRRPRSW